MSANQSEPLIGPIRRRTWREVLRCAPLTASPHVALVITRRGRLVSVLPANARLTLSDYLDWPFEYREVDMRERLLQLDLQLESRDIGYTFLVALRLIYQVVRPERVAIEHADVLRELEEAITQRARAIARALGIEQSGLLKEYLVEALTSGNELPDRFEKLGLALRRADVAIELESHARQYAEAVREQTREHPLVLHFTIESNQPGAMFDVQVGGFYRMRSRESQPHSAATAEDTLRKAVQRTLQRVAADFAPHQDHEASTAMTDELWHDAVLKATLAADNLELLRPSAQARSGRRALIAPPAAPLLTDNPGPLHRPLRARLALPAPASASTGAPHAAADEPAHTEVFIVEPEPAPESSFAPPSSTAAALAHDPSPEADGAAELDWDAIAANVPTFATKGVPYDAPHQEHYQDDLETIDEDDGPASPWLAPLEPPVVDDPGMLATGNDDQPATLSAAPAQMQLPDATDDTPDWIAWQTALAQGHHDGDTADSALPAWHAAAPSHEDEAPPERRPAPLPIHELVARWIELLQSSGSTAFTYRARTIVAHPERTAAIICSLTDDPTLCDRVDDPRCCKLLATALYGVLNIDHQSHDAERPVAIHTPDVASPATPADEDEPDWLIFRHALKDPDPQ
ncbi:MAG: hypothetical protein HXY39_14445 [Chloroflexi bacterium]|nr:hypothetical protein [Chloroflexota bacterium]